jgi:hypothetical protein
LRWLVELKNRANMSSPLVFFLRTYNMNFLRVSLRNKRYTHGSIIWLNEAILRVIRSAVLLNGYPITALMMIRTLKHKKIHLSI